MSNLALVFGAMDTPIVGARYRHYKNKKEYVVLSLGRWQDNAMPVVTYQGQYDDLEFGNKPVWVRSVAEFMAMVEDDGVMVSRFTLIE